MKQNEEMINKAILEFCNGDKDLANHLKKNSLLLDYLERKTTAINRDSKSRYSFANLYAIYVVTEDYIKVKKTMDYKDYKGLNFSKALARVKSLPFGAKLQNHALNSRCNEEFKKYFSNQDLIPIVRDTGKGKYWAEPKLLNIKYKDSTIDISFLVITIIDKYIKEVQKNFNNLLSDILSINKRYSESKDETLIINFIKEQLNPNVDARTFEIIAFVILKYYYQTQKIYFGKTRENIKETTLELYKTGRTNANDGGIDYILKPLGSIFQVTEDLNFKKYFLDIDKLNYYSITFVIKTYEDKKIIKNKIYEDAKSEFNDEILNKYINCFEDIITINELLEYLDIIINQKLISNLLSELVNQTIFEFNIEKVKN